MAIDLKKLKPTTVSRDLKGKFVFLYGPAKIGKTTLAVQFPRNLLLAVEHGLPVPENVLKVLVTVVNLAGGLDDNGVRFTASCDVRLNLRALLIGKCARGTN